MGLLYREAGYRSRFALEVNLFVYTNIKLWLHSFEHSPSP